MNRTESIVTRSKKKLESITMLKEFQRNWWSETVERLRQGEPFAICNADEAEEIFIAFDMPVIVRPWWSAIISAKRMSEYYGNILAEHGWDMNQYASLGL
ncbi:2-hydroxyacyl-CoA dehydratase, partial [Thermodesulfobacteriota bacterium]